MTSGSVYILFNPSYPGLVKIGWTSGPVQARAKRLSGATGVPTPFIVVYDELVDDAHAVEHSLHRRLDAYRVNERREFFRVSISEALRSLQAEVRKQEPIQEHEILPALIIAHGKHLMRDFVSVKISTRPWACYLETTRRKCPELADEIVERVDLSFIASDEDIDDEMFRPADGAAINAARFLRLDLCMLAHCTDLLTDEASEAAAYA